MTHAWADDVIYVAKDTPQESLEATLPPALYDQMMSARSPAKAYATLMNAKAMDAILEAHPSPGRRPFLDSDELTNIFEWWLQAKGLKYKIRDFASPADDHMIQFTIQTGGKSYPFSDRTIDRIRPVPDESEGGS